MNKLTKTPNKLITEKSPYLLQHAQNPVSWYPWSSEAFELAKKENKPIFLSIGYSTCHWCHVMEHESFEDEEVAALMNDAFISIKVDREERPDIDNIYMTVCQLMTGSGGWPMTIIMTPDKKPFFSGTYFPKDSKYGLGMLDLIPKIKELWEKKQSEVISSASEVVEFLKKVTQETPPEDLNKSIINTAFRQLSSRFDAECGGFGNAPKFPSAHNLLFLMRCWKQTKNQPALKMVEKTLQCMQMGGIYDHIGYGFHRYSTDSQWLVPHFEKMLYDQAMLAVAYSEAFQITKKQEYKKTACEIFEYVLRDMTSPDGGFYSAEDADSEGEEGKFYVWTEEEIRNVLNKDEADLIIDIFNIKEAGTNILYIEKSVGALHVTPLLRKLFEERKKRIHPHKDDKILVDWNGLVIAALGIGFQTFEDTKLLKAAQNAADFILNRMKTSDGGLFHRCRDGEISIHGYLDDYAFFIWGLIELYEATFEVKYLKQALELNEYLKDHFWDNKNGGFYFTSDVSENLIIRKKEFYDGAIPSGNSVQMLNLLRLAHLTGNLELREMAEKLSKVFSKNIKESPLAFTHFLSALDFSFSSVCEIVISGELNSSGIKAMINVIREKYNPNKIVLFNPLDEKSPEIHKISSFIKDKKSDDTKATAFICFNFSCKQPIKDLKELSEFLEEC